MTDTIDDRWTNGQMNGQPKRRTDERRSMIVRRQL